MRNYNKTNYRERININGTIISCICWSILILLFDNDDSLLGMENVSGISISILKGLFKATL